MSLNMLAFWRAMIENPRLVGSIAPSSRLLGEAIAEEVLSSAPGHVIELGAGTGSITEALYEVRHHFDSFSVVERSPNLARCLKQEFPDINVYPICASNFGCLHLDDVDVMTVVSSLPFRSLPEEDVVRIQNTIFSQHKRCTSFRFIQYTYLGRVPFVHEGIHWTKKKTVFANLPPATVWGLSMQVCDETRHHAFRSVGVAN